MRPQSPLGGSASPKAFGARVLLSCLDCHHYHSMALEAVIKRLQDHGLGDERTGIKAVAIFVSRPCPRCGGWRFDTRPDFPEDAGAVGA